MKIAFLGAPGVGKGTYSSRVGPQLGIPHISTGDLCRAEIANGSELGQKIKQIVEAGNLVDDETILEMLKKRLEHPDAEKGFILDGYPRNLNQAKALESITQLEIVINIKLDENILIQKIAARRICKKCGNIYNVANIRVGDLHMPPMLPEKEGICDKCEGELYQRNDDQESVVKDRIKVYHDQTAPLIDYYKNKAILFDIDVSGPPEKMVPIIIEKLKFELGEE